VTVPSVTGSQMAAVDRIMAERFGVQPVQLMEVAGHAIADAVRSRFARSLRGHDPIVILAGSGGNGGDALVAARFLHAWGAPVRIITSKPVSTLTGLAGQHLQSAAALGIPIDDASTDLSGASLVIDGLLGFSTTEPPTGRTTELIERANAQPAPVLAIDVPSGMNATTGEAYEPCIRATVTVTLALPKRGLLEASARPWVGSLLLADIGIPPAAYTQLCVNVPPNLFATGTIVPVPHGEGIDG
jgi:NAD(P)H-hydrate epimerase